LVPALIFITPLLETRAAVEPSVLAVFRPVSIVTKPLKLIMPPFCARAPIPLVPAKVLIRVTEELALITLFVVELKTACPTVF